MEFERSESGMYLPARSLDDEQAALPKAVVNGGWTKTVINALMVFIQLVTVWVLWLTYQNTVIPTRQKELLAEQVAQLEMERQRITSEIARSRRDAQVASAALEERQIELRTLLAEKQRLGRAVSDANRSALASLHEADRARLQASATSGQLGAAQLRLFKQRAGFAVAHPALEYSYQRLSSVIKQVNETLGRSSERETIDAFIEQIEADWPNYQRMVGAVNKSLSDTQGELFPKSFVSELDAYLQDRTASMQCDKPDFVILRAKYDSDVARNLAKMAKEREERNATLVADGVKKGIRYTFDRDVTKQEDEIYKWSAQNDARNTLRQSVDDVAGQCFKNFESLAADYFNKKEAAR